MINVCNTIFNKIDINDENYRGEERIFGDKQTDYDKDCNIIHRMSYLNNPDYIKLICILTHELGHVMTEPKPLEINEYGIYPLVKRTTTVYEECEYQGDTLLANNRYGFRMADGFLESICTKIFASPEFRQELDQLGYDLQDYVYKDERIFPSRVYDEFKACFELFDYLMDGVLFDFSCKTFSSNEEFVNYINKYKLNLIFKYLDKSNDALWALKSFEDKEYDENFDKLLQVYLEEKSTSLTLALVLIFMKKVKKTLFLKNYLIFMNQL